MADVKLYLANRDEKRKRNRRRLRIVLLIALVIGFLFALWWVLFRSPIFKVSEILITGNRRTKTPDVIALLENNLKQSGGLPAWFGTQYVWVWPQGAWTNNLEDLPRIKTIVIKKNYGTRKIEVAVEERGPYGIWCLRKKTPAECFWFEDDGGTIFEPAPEVEGSLIKIIDDYATDEVKIGERILPEPLMPGLLTILSVLTEAPIQVKEVRYEDPSLQEMRVMTYDGPQIYFSLRFSASNALPIIKSLKEKDRLGELKPRFRELQYIDFRIQGRAYYK